MTRLAVALIYLWVGWLSPRAAPTVTAVFSPPAAAPAANGPAQWVGIETVDGGLVQTGTFSLAGGTYEAFIAFCQPAGLCTPQWTKRLHGRDRLRFGVVWLGGARWRASVWDRTAGWAVWRYDTYRFGTPTHDLWVAETQSSVPWRGVAVFSRPTAVPVAPITDPLSGLRPAGRFRVVGQ